MSEELIPVGDGAEHLADMDEIKLIAGICPRQRHVVDLEDAIGRDKSRLDWGEVDSGDSGTGVLIGHVSEEKKKKKH